MPELRWTLLILGALFIGGLALWEWRRQRHARGPGNVSAPHVTGGREGERLLADVRWHEGATVAFRRPSMAPYPPPLFLADLGTRRVSRADADVPGSLRRRSPGDSRDRFADPPVVELDDESLDRLKVEAGEAVDEFSEPREPGEAVDDFSEDADEPSPAEPMVPRLSPAAWRRRSAPQVGSPMIGASRAHDARARPVAASRRSSASPSRRSIRTTSRHPIRGVRRRRRAATPARSRRSRTDARDACAAQPRLVRSRRAHRRVARGRHAQDRRAAPRSRAVGERFAGRAVRLALAAEGFVLGKFDIFHKPGPDARAVLSAASLTKPGTFALATMDAQRFGGISLFAVLLGPLSPARQRSTSC